MLSVLVIEDDKTINSLLCSIITKSGYSVDSAENGLDGLDKALSGDYNIILMDLMLPLKTGEEVLKKLRSVKSTPVIIISAKLEVYNRIELFKIGADDYITKPFSMRELLARVKANIRRTAMLQAGAEETAAVITAGGLSINPENYQVAKHGAPVDLTQREYELLVFLAGHPGKVYSRTDLMEQVWNYDYVGDDVRTVDVTVRRLREKIEDDPASPALILTKRGVGYYFAAQ